MIRRRDFLHNIFLGGGALLASRGVPFATAFESQPPVLASKFFPTNHWAQFLPTSMGTSRKG